MANDQEVRCTDSCGKTAESVEAAIAKGWYYLQITGRIRCVQCQQALDKVNEQFKEKS